MDDIDHQIVALLVADARSSYGDIGEAVGLSAPAVKRRVDRLRESRVLLGFTAVVNPAALGPVVEAFLELHCAAGTRPEEIRHTVEPLREVVTAFTVTGDADALVHVRTHSIAELEDTIEAIRVDPKIERTVSVVVLSRLLDRQPALPSTVRA